MHIFEYFTVEWREASVWYLTSSSPAFPDYQMCLLLCASHTVYVTRNFTRWSTWIVLVPLALSLCWSVGFCRAGAMPSPLDPGRATLASGQVQRGPSEHV